MKKFKKLMVSLLAGLMLVTCISKPVMAADEDKHLVLETNIDKTLEIPLTLNSSTDNFYVNANINPGDIMKADIVFKNTSKEPIQVRISDITDQLNTTDSTALLEVLKLTISMNGSPIYTGSHKNVTSPLTQWITLEGGSALTVNVNVEFPKYEADNRFQGSEMKIKYVFEARADVPMDETSETIKTGVDEVKDTNPMAVAIIVVAVVLCIGLVSYMIIKKKKDKNNNQNN